MSRRRIGDGPKLPHGPVWRATTGVHERARSARHRLFLELVSPAAHETILDVGATDSEVPWTNHLEAAYARRDRITAVAVERLRAFKLAFPEVHTVAADGCELPFADGAFDIVYSNAVIEHVGDRERQRRFLSEAYRVAVRAVFITTPSRWFPMETHTMIPLVHWGPRPATAAVWRWAGHTYYADPAHLNLLSAGGLRRLARAAGLTSFIVRTQRLYGCTSNLILIAEKGRTQAPSD